MIARGALRIPDWGGFPMPQVPLSGRIFLEPEG
jgi:hypothetical protein